MIKVAFVIDESGSMGWMRDKVISLINDQHEVLSENESEVYYYKFSNEAKKVRNLYSKRLVPFTRDDYSPNGSTALYDAVILAFKEMTKNHRSDDKYLFIVVSDGEENASKASYSDLKEVLDSKLAKKYCTFTYLGGTQDLSDKAVRMYKFDFTNTAVFNPDWKVTSNNLTRGINLAMNSYTAGANTVTNFYSE